MPPPSHLAIATSSINRLLKEEASYHKELAEQEAQVKALEEKLARGDDDADGNGAYILKQNQTVLEQTKAVFGPLRERISEAAAKLEEQIALREESGAPEEEMAKAKEALGKARAELNGTS